MGCFFHVQLRLNPLLEILSKNEIHHDYQFEHLNDGEIKTTEI